jgi:hypothetical protein
MAGSDYPIILAYEFARRLFFGYKWRTALISALAALGII